VDDYQATIDHLPAAQLARRDDPDTSKAAAADLGETAATMRLRLLRAFAVRDMTAEEAAVACGFGPERCAWKRVSDLENLGFIFPTGRTRVASSGKEQRVHSITAPGRRELV
jgi:hypothetical protein